MVDFRGKGRGFLDLIDRIADKEDPAVLGLAPNIKQAKNSRKLTETLQKLRFLNSVESSCNCFLI